MSSRKSYVVYNGRKPSVYMSWIDCYAQANGYKDNVVRLYDDYSDGQTAWDSYNRTTSSLVMTKSHIERVIEQSYGYTSEILSNITERADDSLLTATDRAPIGTLIRDSMQRCLRDACMKMRIGEPMYTLHDVKNIDGIRNYRYRACLMHKIIGKPRVSLGRYARDEDDARDDVAVLLLRRLLSSTGQKIVDYNQYSVDLLESQLQRVSESNFDLRMENAALTEELKLMIQKQQN